MIFTPDSAQLQPRIPVRAVKLAGRWASARLFRRERSPAFTGSPTWWDPAQVWDHVIEVEVDVEDATGEGPPFPLTISSPCFAHPETPEALPFWRALVHRAALHEADEALRVGWAAPFDPHGEGDLQREPVDYLHRLTRAGCKAIAGVGGRPTRPLRPDQRVRRSVPASEGGS